MNILGGVDFNVAACPLESHRKNLLEICKFCQYQQLINVHIQITDKSATTINLFLTDNKNVIRIPGSVTLVLVTILLSTSLENNLFPKRKPKIPKFVDYKMFKQRMLIPGK